LILLQSLEPGTKLITSWHKVVLAQTERSLGRGLEILTMAERTHAQLGHPGGFAVFSGPETANNQATSQQFAFYFSPVAAGHCMEALVPLGVTKCERPNRNEPGFGLAYGEGSRSWDLLD
jgi:hypothetical protein